MFVITSVWSLRVGWVRPLLGLDSDQLLRGYCELRGAGQPPAPRSAPRSWSRLVLETIGRFLKRTARLNIRATHPSTYQLLLVLTTVDEYALYARGAMFAPLLLRPSKAIIRY
jgi:hypothetical protein